jgi:hypothetical protein
MISELRKADFCQQAAPQGNAWRMTLNETVFIAAVAILLLSLSMVVWVKPLQALTFSLVQVDENGNSVEGG